MKPTDLPLVLAMSGASGVVYAVRLLELLLRAEQHVYLTISSSARVVIRQEMGLEVQLDHFDPVQLVPAEAVARGRVTYCHYRDFMTPIASGSHRTRGMIICPCSGSTLSGVAHGTSGNLIQRAADVHLKERRKLILVTRETPLSLMAIDNMRRVCEAGGVILPAMPGWYHGVRSLQDLVDFVVARILDQLEIDHQLMRRWGDEPIDD